MKPNSKRVPEPDNPTFNNTQAPTVDKRDAKVDVIKHNFNQTFTIPEFEGRYKTVQTNNNRKTVYERKNGKKVPVYDNLIREKGKVNPDFM